MIEDYNTIKEIINLMRKSVDLGDNNDLFLGICESKLKEQLDLLKKVYEDMKKEL